MSDLHCHITTFNAGREEIHIDYFASSLYASFKSGVLPPDFIVLALQEIAPIGFSFLGGSLLAPYFSRFAEAVYRATEWKYGEDTTYEHVLTRNLGMTGIMVFARPSAKESIKLMEEAGTGVGLWEMGNKGAVGVRLGLDDDTTVTFVAAHLAPMEEAVERRNEDWRNICKTLVFEPIDSTGREGIPQPLIGEQEHLLSGDSESREQQSNEQHSLFTPPSYIFFAGDLNYRTSDHAPDPKTSFQTWPQPTSTDADPTHYRKLLTHDQLTRELHLNRTLHNLSEHPINFPPTYKYSSKAMQLTKENAQKLEAAKKSKDDGASFPGLELHTAQEQAWLWAKHRTPSWCDRILFLADEYAPAPEVSAYGPLPIQPTSDHRPVSLIFSILRKSVKGGPQKFKIDEDWGSRRAWARRLEVIVGLGAYLTLTGQGEALLAGTIVGVVGGYFALAALLGYIG